ncbi:MAG TPA: protease pro-enzyme activation domain-containing protein [Acidimicrobiales bacterium]|nr:protease pro-enzyme activation domain-containing protein [Acidimicrobiales bacterium]
MRVGLPPRLPSGAASLGAPAPSTTLELDVVLRPRRSAELAALVSAVSTPGSSRYHHYLRRGEFARRFGASAAAVRAVERRLRAVGLTPTGVSADRLAVHVTADAAQVARAFATPLLRYRLGSGADVFANVEAPRLPAAIARDVVGVLGLDSLSSLAPVGLDHLVARPAVRAAGTAPRLVAHAGPTPTASCTQSVQSAQAGYTADQIAGAYGLDGLYSTGDLGAGTTVAVIEFAGYVSSDIASYASCYGGSIASNVTAVPVDNGPGNYDAPSAVEAELDIEDVLGLAPAARILVYEAPNNGGDPSGSAAYDAYAAAVNADLAQVISTSWGGCEAQTGQNAATAESALFEQAALQGQSVVAASGDSGSEDCYNPLSSSGSKRLAVDDPASQPYVTGVGGTTLAIGSTPQDTVWNTQSGTQALGEPGAGGGGVSSLWPMPTYQSSAPASLNVVNSYSTTGGCGAAGGCREVPDVSADAGAPYAIYCTEGQFQCAPGGWTSLGGTSAAAPTFAAILALADASAACAAAGPVGFANPALYAIADGNGYASAFNDVTQGNNDLTGTNGGQYEAGPGYDLASGLGTPIVGSGSDGGLVAQLCASDTRGVVQRSLPLPAVTSVRPGSAGAAGGARVTVTGRNLAGATAVDFGLRAARSFTRVSATRLEAVVPAGDGSVHVTVTAFSGTSRRTRADVFSYISPPLVERVVPSGGPAAGGTVVVLVGRHLSQVREVRFGRVPARILKRSATRIVAVAPAGSGLVEVVAEAPGGGSRRLATDRYRYLP